MGPDPLGTELTPYNHQGVNRSAWPQRVFITDCTLRDGEQQAGLVMSPETKLKIARLLAEAGVYEIEAGTPAVSDEDRLAVEAIVSANLGCRISALALARTDDIDLVAETGAWGVRISLPAGVLQLKHKLRLTASEYVKIALTVTEYAKHKGLYVVFSPYDTTRAEEGFLRTVVKEISRAQTVDRIRLVDTTGSATPAAMRYLVRLIKEESAGLPVEVHVHDDFGLATANTLAAVTAGAEFVSCTVNGLGERAGNAALEEVAAVLELLFGIETGIELERLTALSQAVSWLTRIPLPVSKPIVGANAFAHESGIVVAGVLKEPLTGEPFPPATVGQQRRIVIGKKSGSASIRARLAAMGRPTDEQTVTAILETVKIRAGFLERSLNDEEFAEVVNRVLADKAPQ